MKIECVEGFDIGPEKFSRWLTVGKVYHVLAIERRADGGTWFRVVTGEGDAKPENVALFRSENFRLLSGLRPSTWTDIELNGMFESSPVPWQAEGFWEAFYDGDDDAFSLFEREREANVAEES